MIKAYRFFRVSKDKKPTTLFHSLNGSKSLKLNTLLNAEIKQVHNPGKKTSKSFTSGFHIFLTKQIADKYLTKFKNKNNIVISRVLVSNMHNKPTTVAQDVYLANQMIIKEKDWNIAIK